jgi:hypothetical protein
MTITETLPAALAGQAFDCHFGGFVPRLTFQSPDRLRVQALIGDATIDQVVPLELVEVRPNVYIVSWVEENGNFIVQLQDHEKGVVHNHARLADSQIFRAEGRLQRIAAQ